MKTKTNNFFVFTKKKSGNNNSNLQFSPPKNKIILIFMATDKRILLKLSKNVRKAPIY